MKRIFSYFKNDRTVKSATLMVGGHGLANIGAYLYHLFMGRLLVPNDYGALQSLISLSNLLNVPIASMNTVVAKFVSRYVGRDEPQKIASLYYQLRKLFFIFLIIGGTVFLLFSDMIMNFLHLDSWVNVLILDIALFFGLVNFLNRGVLQGLSLFVPLTITQFIEAFGKFFFGVVAVVLGLRIPGAFGAFVLVMFISYAYMIRVLHGKLGTFTPQSLPLREMGRYAIPSGLMTIGITALYNTDVVLVRHFMTGYEAGLYAGLSVLGKIIFFGTAPVTTVMFPLVSEAHARGEAFHRIFLLSLFFLLGIAGTTTLIFALVPTLAMKALIGAQYLDAVPYLTTFSIFISLCAVIYLFVNFFLSIHKTRSVYVVLLAALIQAVAIWFFHPTIWAVISISLTVTTICAVLLTLYYIYVARS
ncbi:hypothetical protein A2875_02525 [Candidatus Gottesmanbacteria bacterium RIFCSPHIGHO2_01_FULL_46_14]|uniref:Polysaccharide biosynthesis protein C-terminal domain-containing protein n=3 Tax=Microgenomates group TaxID=1794810 RepID=A0A1F5ZN55_9BACT|nr:MAG: Polysaccharide biosynthesis protein [Candidatus Curtissbacteria bacterium GW2011_GWA1_41_11]OGG13775.1 MAG: hypothetical protein A2875_02525 [Candidatus Gottesmanbacteria bacterium RIFCSPHIGHO2_01_FULL_46_14]OGG28625.1 MAG: hypothetical protein A2971_04800 [Candidatus Gottesmanbacteria bacterium RIFCSPLOWO2_01_FULL_46_21]